MARVHSIGHMADRTSTHEGGVGTDVDLNDPNANPLEAGTGDNIKTSAGPTGLILPADQAVLAEARRMIGDRDVRIEDLSTCASQDPALVIEFLRIANAMYFSAGRPPITTTKQAIQRLGSDVSIDLLDKMRERPAITDEDVAHWFEVHRSRCRRTSITARILAEVNAKQLADDCQSAGLMLHVGELIAVAYFQDRYVSLAEEYSRSSVNFRLAQDFKFDIEKNNLLYLRRNGIPEVLLFALDREAMPKTPDRAISRPICAAAAEMVDAFDANRWEKLAPGKKLPPMSPIRILGFTENQYLKVYERVSEYLFSIRMLEERKKSAALSAQNSAAKVEAPSENQTGESTSEHIPDANSELENDILNIIRSAKEVQKASTPSEEPPQIVTPKPAKIPQFEVQKPRKMLGKEMQRFNLEQLEPKIKARKQTPVKIVTPPPMRTEGGNGFIESLCDIVDAVKSSEELLGSILQKLVHPDGPFNRSALIVVAGDRKSAIVVAARGPSIGNGQQIELDDPLSPLAQCFSKVQSFGNKANENSPFGSKAFALSPIDCDHETPVALYADCGDEGSITFEARRVFRNVVNILNQKLPQIPGGVLVELG